MNILICTYSITRTAGGVFDAVKDLFTNKTFHKHNLKIISFSDKHIDEDISSWKNIPIQLFKAGPLLYSRQMKRYMIATNADILPSHGEGLPMTILEAWSWKLPVVMTPQCNIPEGFEANAAIRIEDNVSSIKQGLQTLFNMSDEERISMGNRGYKLVSENFTWDASAQKMIMLYKWLTNQGEKPDFVYE